MIVPAGESVKAACGCKLEEGAGFAHGSGGATVAASARPGDCGVSGVNFLVHQLLSFILCVVEVAIGAWVIDKL